ncbi:MAG: ABC transporter ATP-binding protein/permease [Oscillospiraceae bacterium]|nr:ABC transporter ATP-binding protein/permease [Oscillospiraceae bacterium]
MMRIDSREYRLIDFLKIPFAISPGLASLRVADKIVYALIPALQIVTTALFIDTAIDIFNGQAEPGGIVFPLVCMLLLVAHQYVNYALIGLVKAKMDIKLTEAFRTAITEKRAMLEYRHIENNDVWDIISRVGDDPVGKMGGGFDIVLRLGDMVLRVGAVLLILVAQVWWAALVVLCLSAPLLWLAVKSGKAQYETSKEAAKHARRAQYLQGVLSGRDNVEERALFGYAGNLNRRYHEKYTAAYKINMRAQRKRYIRIKSASLTTILLSFLVAGVLIAPLGSGEISIGMFMGFVTATFGLAQLLSWDLADTTSALSNNREYLRDLSLFAQLSETPGAADMPDVGAAEPQRIEFRGVSFAYPGTRRLILDDLCMTMHAGRHYAFVGANGSGKTTITKLLTGLYDNYTGDILIDGKNLREFPQPALKAIFSIVYQDFAKYQIPLADSIGLGDVNNATEQSIGDAIETLSLTETVARLPEGANTPLGRIKEGGADLSGGEWQRVAISRSLVSGAPVRILDEPTAELDPVAESDVYKLFAKISAGKSTIFITHRLGAARLADEIFVIEGGHVAEQGAHGELMLKNGLYAQMFEAQRGWYA